MENKEITNLYKQRNSRKCSWFNPLDINRESSTPVDKGIKFSIIFPTRERTKLLKSFLDSIYKNTYCIEEIEVLIAIDEDDVTDYSFLTEYKFLQSFSVKRSLNFSQDYYNFLASKSKGSWIITANDDCMCETKNWDHTVYNILKVHNGVVYGFIEDGLGGFRVRGQREYCCFPLFGRIGYEALGYVFPGRIPTWGADIWAANLYHQVSSVVKLPITFRHYSYHNRSRQQDHISRRIASNQIFYSVRPGREEMEKLLNAMNKKKQMAEV